MNRSEEIKILQSHLLKQIENLFEGRFTNHYLIGKILEKADKLKEYNRELIE